MAKAPPAMWSKKKRRKVRRAGFEGEGDKASDPVEPSRIQSPSQRERDARDFEARLQRELDRFERMLGTDYGLKVVWLPDGSESLEGEVRGSTVYVYSKDREKAFETLRHEFLDFLVGKAIEPYREVSNALIKMVNDLAYRRKERIVEALRRLLFVEYLK